MKEILLEYATYNLWANAKIIETIKALTDEQQHRHVISSFSSLQLTLQHMMNAEHIWWQRIKLVEAVLPMSDTTISVQEIAVKLSGLSKQWKEWIEKSTINALEHEFVYRNSKKEQFKQPVYQMLLHLFNHQTYHRGQLVTILKQLGVDQIPPTDFIVWSRGKK